MVASPITFVALDYCFPSLEDALSVNCVARDLSISTAPLSPTLKLYMLLIRPSFLNEYLLRVGGRHHPHRPSNHQPTHDPIPSYRPPFCTFNCAFIERWYICRAIDLDSGAVSRFNAFASRQNPQSFRIRSQQTPIFIRGDFVRILKHSVTTFL